MPCYTYQIDKACHKHDQAECKDHIHAVFHVICQIHNIVYLDKIIAAPDSDTLFFYKTIRIRNHR